MRNLTIEQQKEFEKMIAKINGLHQENEDLVKSYNKQLQQLHSINKNLIKEVDKLKKEKLELIKENNKINKINKRLSSYEKCNDMPSEEEYADYYEALEKEYCE